MRNEQDIGIKHEIHDMDLKENKKTTQILAPINAPSAKEFLAELTCGEILKTPEFTCRDCMAKSRIVKQKSFMSYFRNFRNRQDYVPQEESFQTNQSRISDKEFDEIIQEFEQAHWSEISSAESQKHKQYIESLFKREFFHRR
ncbi:hypothetical protein YTPLAS73_09710 [Nitrosarchaeum sp.]|nr:hypothetical protein YTPLAS73_09710 [Nitrosarchaeum sp.]